MCLGFFPRFLRGPEGRGTLEVCARRGAAFAAGGAGAACAGGGAAGFESSLPGSTASMEAPMKSAYGPSIVWVTLARISRAA